jgi:acetylornithine deacetylase
MMEALFNDSVSLLKKLIAIESVSQHEDETAEVILGYLKEMDIAANRSRNNIWVRNKYYDATKPSILLNSHHDTVKPNASYSRDPFYPSIEDAKLYGLGSNDAGGALVSLLASFLYFYQQQNLKYNLVYAATAEEETSGKHGIESLLPELGKIDFGIVGEPTNMQMAIAGKGLLVLDCEAIGQPGHAARDEGDNAIYKAIKDIEWFRTYQFPKVSELLGAVKMTCTMIKAGLQHNVVPGTCHFTVDIRTTEQYTHTEILDIVKTHTSSQIQARSMRLKPSYINRTHPIVQAGLGLGLEAYGSPTMSDQALMDFPSLKIGPGDSARSHMADEFIYLHEIGEGIHIYINLLKNILI